MSVFSCLCQEARCWLQKKTDLFEELGKNHYYVEATNNRNSKYTVGAYIVD